MPARLLPVEHYIQEADAGCAPVVLNYMGINRSQVVP